MASLVGRIFRRIRKRDKADDAGPEWRRTVMDWPAQRVHEDNLQIVYLVSVPGQMIRVPVCFDKQQECYFVARTANPEIFVLKPPKEETGK